MLSNRIQLLVIISMNIFVGLVLITMLAPQLLEAREQVKDNPYFIKHTLLVWAIASYGFGIIFISTTPFLLIRFWNNKLPQHYSE